MIENEIYCYINDFLKWNISKKTSHIVGNKKFSGKIFILNLRNNKYLWKSNRSVLTMKEDCRGNGQD